MKKKFIFLGMGLFILLSIVLSGDLKNRCLFSDSDCKKYNIVIIASDALRANNLPCYGYDKNTSPAICSFSEEEGAFLFSNAISQKPTTSPGVYSTMSGKFPFQIRNGGNLDDTILLAEILKKEGYQTLGAVGTNMVSRGTGFERGIDFFIDVYDQKTSKDIASVAADELTKSATKLLERVEKDKPFFLWVFYKDTHAPYLPPEPYNTLFIESEENRNSEIINNEKIIEKGTPKYAILGDNLTLSFYISQYDGEIKFFDDHVKILIDKLKEMGVYDNTIIVITSDHGESLGEHDFYFDHGFKLDEMNIKIPLIIKFPNITINRKIDSLVILSDITPTILSYNHIDFKSNFDGLDLTKYIFKNAAIQRNIFLQNDRLASMIGVTNSRWKFIYHLENQDTELYDLSLDKEEKNNLNNKNKEIIDKYKALCLNNNNLITSFDDKSNKEAIEKLKSLGYID